MGQPEVFEFLRSNKDKWFTARQISDETNSSPGSVSVALKMLRKSGQVNNKKIFLPTGNNAKRASFIYCYKSERQTTILEY